MSDLNPIQAALRFDNKAIELLPIDAADKYEMLNTFDTTLRLKALDDLSFSIAPQ